MLWESYLRDLVQQHQISRKLNCEPCISAIVSLTYSISYDEAMRRIQSQEEGFRNLAEQILSWIVWAVRPLTVPELQHALSIEPGDDELDEDNFLDANDLTSVCAGLVIIDQERQLIRLVHYTTQEYFERRRDELFGGIQNKIAATCITYLCLEIFNDPCPDLEVLLNRVTEYPLLAYAAPYWGHHVRATSELIQRDYIMRLLTEHSRLISAIQIKHYLEGNPVWVILCLLSAMHFQTVRRPF